ncbi:MAG: hypothetical protein Q7T96_18370 [Methylobacter sp.]|nr:hypothetical protein [Methylobacter sp.]
MNKSIASRLAKIQAKRLLTMMPIVIFYRSSTGLSIAQKQRINDAKQSGRGVKLIKTFVADVGS